MITCACVHCGKQMQVTEEEGLRKATCSSCGRVVQFPVGEPTVRWLRRTSTLRRAVELEPTRITPPPIPVIQGVGVEPPTRLGDAVPHDPVLTSFLSPAQESDELGRLGPYRVLDILGHGGMGVVYRAHDPSLDRIVALKAMLPAIAASGTAKQRFLREAKLAAAIQHDRVVTIFQVGEERGIPYLAMPLLRGESLDQRLRRAVILPVEEALRITREIAEGLSAIHELGLVHRDIKPGNVFLEGESSRVKILDFGLARAVTEEIRLTQDGLVVGSPAYMAPEQASRRSVDGRADLFSLGCILYQMLNGLLPFERADALGTMLAVQNEDPVAIPNLPTEVWSLVQQLLAKSPDERPASAREVVRIAEELEDSLPIS